MCLDNVEFKLLLFQLKIQILLDNGTFILPVIWFSKSKLSSEIRIDLFTFRDSIKILEPKFHVSNSKNKDLLYNGTFVLPDLVNMASLCSGIGSDLTAPFKPPGWKNLILKVWKKVLEKQRNGTKKTLTGFLSGV